MIRIRIATLVRCALAEVCTVSVLLLCFIVNSISDFSAVLFNGKHTGVYLFYDYQILNS